MICRTRYRHAGRARAPREVSWEAMHPVNCHHCGAPMQPGADGRLYKCGYCGTKAQVAIGADQIAAGMALDMSNIETFLGSPRAGAPPGGALAGAHRGQRARTSSASR